MGINWVRKLLLQQFTFAAESICNNEINHTQTCSDSKITGKLGFSHLKWYITFVKLLSYFVIFSCDPFYSKLLQPKWLASKNYTEGISSLENELAF